MFAMKKHNSIGNMLVKISNSVQTKTYHNMNKICESAIPLVANNASCFALRTELLKPSVVVPLLVSKWLNFKLKEKRNLLICVYYSCETGNCPYNTIPTGKIRANGTLKLCFNNDADNSTKSIYVNMCPDDICVSLFGWGSFIKYYFRSRISLRHIALRRGISFLVSFFLSRDFCESSLKNIFHVRFVFYFRPST